MRSVIDVYSDLARANPAWSPEEEAAFVKNDRIRKELEGADSPLRFRRYLKEDIKEALDESIAKFCKRNNYSPHVFSICGDTADLDDWDFLTIDVNMWWIRHGLDELD